MCTPCKDYYADVVFNPREGIDRPENAPEDWRPSLMEHLRHAQIAMAFNERNLKPAPERNSLARPDDAKRYTSAQLKQVMVLRKYLYEAAQ